ncbi:hypothetical protein [Rhizobium sp. TRM95796]|uniref:hypothetical protein n=1 Tax=Rhizobium sp. TRM95796 TaxID=2979862 RepID=UPI0021E858BE|nr:hypothetical protein [Rhizobium sp. TRM95796]MCV3768735.1 hypothetical protein [Rhizobium sp. TRM95796]
MIAQDTHKNALKPLALLAAGMSGADIERIIRELRGKGRRRDDPDAPMIAWSDLEQALLDGKNLPSPAMARRVAVHELGHALAYETLGIARVIHVRVGGERGGETRTRMNIEAIQTEAGMMHWTACLLAGQAAEKLVYGSALMGAGGTSDSDLARATSIALDLETSFGVGVDMPLLYRSPANSSETLLYNSILSGRVYKRLEEAETIAHEVLARRLDFLAGLAEQLAAEIVLDGGRLRAAMADGAAE